MAKRVAKIGRASWLSVTPEPEYELPEAVATLAAGARAAPEAVAAERIRIERLVLHGRQRQWLDYLHGVVELVAAREGSADLDVERARRLAIAVLSNHHNLLQALPGRGAQMTAADRERLGRLLTTTRPVHDQGHARLGAA